MKMKEIVNKIKNNHVKVLTITKTKNGIEWPVISSKYQNIPVIYYIMLKYILIKVGQSKNLYKRNGSYRTETRKLNENKKHGPNGSWITPHKLNELMNVGDTAEIYAWFIKPKNSIEIHDGIEVPMTVDMLELETRERNRLNPLLK